MNFKNRMLTFLLLFSFAFSLSCEKDDREYPHPPEAQFREALNQNRANLEKLISMTKEDMEKSGKDRLSSWEIERYDIRVAEYKEIYSKIVNFKGFKADKWKDGNFEIEIELYESAEIGPHCTQGLYYSTDKVEISSSPLDSINCKSLMNVKNSYRYIK